MELLAPNDIAWGARLSCKDAHAHFTRLGHTTVYISRPLSISCAIAWLQHCTAFSADDPLYELSFNQKLQLLSVAATTGCETNLLVAWGLVKPHLLPGLAPGYFITAFPDGLPDPGTAAASAGHPHLIRWLHQHGCPLLPHETLAAVARHCHLAHLQAAWQLLSNRLADCNRWSFNEPHERKRESLAAAAAASRLDPLPKLQWLLTIYGQDALTEEVAIAAAASSDLSLLQWIHDRRRGLVRNVSVLAAALQHADIAVAAWIMTQINGQGPDRYMADSVFTNLNPSLADSIFTVSETAATLCRAAGASGSLAKLRWLQARRVPASAWNAALDAAAAHGHLETVQHLVQECGLQLRSATFRAAVSSGHVPTAAWLLARGCPVDDQALAAVPLSDGLAMLTWLLDAVHVDMPRRSFPFMTVAQVLEGRGREQHSVAAQRQELAAARLLVSHGMPTGPGGVLRAASSGNMRLVRYLVEECGCSLQSVTSYANPFDTHGATGGCAALIEWVVRRQFPSKRCVTALWVAAARRGDVGSMLLLRRLGVEGTDKTLWVAVLARCPLLVLRWLVEHGVPASGQALADARDGGKALCGATGHSVFPNRKELRELRGWLRGLGP